MHPERWKRIKEVLDVSLRLEAAERAAYLVRACEGDGELTIGLGDFMSLHPMRMPIHGSLIVRSNVGIAAILVCHLKRIGAANLLAHSQARHLPPLRSACF